ncbi:MAG: Holliday junction branch migration protein RuvA, partial [Candidatus Omnitrophota bacterium]
TREDVEVTFFEIYLNPRSEFKSTRDFSLKSPSFIDMIYQIEGRIIRKEENRVVLESKGISYEIHIPKTVYQSLSKEEETAKLIIYHYFNIEKNRGFPVLVGFSDELERDFFEKFISVSGVGPKAALRALDKPISIIAQAIEEGDISFLTSLVGIGKQRAKQIIAHLQGKVGRFALIKEGEHQAAPQKKEILEEAKKILKRLQYNSSEAEKMIKNALETNPKVDTVEELLNEIYRQRK